MSMIIMTIITLIIITVMQTDVFEMLYFKSVFICVLSYYDLCCDYKQAFYHTTCLPAEVKKHERDLHLIFFTFVCSSAGRYVVTSTKYLSAIS